MNLSKMWNKDYVKKWLRSKINVYSIQGKIWRRDALWKFLKYLEDDGDTR